MNQSAPHSYEESVQILRADPAQRELVLASYLDEDTSAAAERFAKSDEWKEIQAYLQGMRLCPPAHVLDLGCGNGIASLAFARMGFSVLAMDPNEGKHSGLSALQEALAQSPALSPALPIELRQGSAENIPAQDASQDLVYLRQAAHHFQNLRQGMSECFRVLKKGGWCFVTREHVVSDDIEREEFLRGHPLHKYHGGEWAYTIEEYESAITQAGFVLQSCLGTYASAINYAPITKNEIRYWLRQGLERRLGKIPASLLASSSFLFSLYTRRLQKSCRYPGRMYSFLARKPL